MLRLALSLVSSLQTGAMIKDTVRRSVRRTVILVAATIILLFAFGFGLVAGYHALMELDLSPLTSAAIVAGILAVIGFVLLMVGLHKPRPKQPDFVNAPAEGLAMVDESVNKAMKQVGPLTLLAVAFAAGLLASRRK
ncbi:MAG: phage holin family protein [Pseudomonadota bacterium]